MKLRIETENSFLCVSAVHAFYSISTACVVASSRPSEIIFLEVISWVYQSLVCIKTDYTWKNSMPHKSSTRSLKVRLNSWKKTCWDYCSNSTMYYLEEHITILKILHLTLCILLRPCPDFVMDMDNYYGQAKGILNIKEYSFGLSIFCQDSGSMMGEIMFCNASTLPLHLRWEC